MKIHFFLTCVLVLFSLPLALAEEKAANNPAAAAQEKQYGSVEERRIMEPLQAAGVPFAREREDLENKKKELKRMEVEVDKKIEQLNQLRVRIEKLLEQKDAEEQKRIEELAKVYEKMTAEKAAHPHGNGRTATGDLHSGKNENQVRRQNPQQYGTGKGGQTDNRFPNLGYPIIRMQVSCVPVDMMPAGPPAAPASAPAGQESLFASRLKTATEKQSSGLPIEAPGNQAGNAPDSEQASATDHVERTEGQRKTATPEISLNGSAGAALLQPATAPNAEVTIVDTLAASGGNLSALQRNVETSLYGLAETALQPAAVGSKAELTPIAGDSNVGFSSALVSESAVAKMLGALTTTEAPAGPQKNSAALATQPAEGTQPAISPGNLEATVAQTPAAAFAPLGQSALISGQSTISDSETSVFHFENPSQAAANTTTAMTLQQLQPRRVTPPSLWPKGMPPYHSPN